MNAKWKVLVIGGALLAGVTGTAAARDNVSFSVSRRPGLCVCPAAPARLLCAECVLRSGPGGLLNQRPFTTRNRRSDSLSAMAIVTGIATGKGIIAIGKYQRSATGIQLLA